jgi:hypothetical protein
LVEREQNAFVTERNFSQKYYSYDDDRRGRKKSNILFLLENLMLLEKTRFARDLSTSNNGQISNVLTIEIENNAKLIGDASDIII